MTDVRAATYGWMISYDHLDHRKDDTAGPHNISKQIHDKLAAAIKEGRTHAAEQKERDGIEWFRMKDDDDELYYTGVRMGDGEDFGSEEGFEPLDDYGMPNAGATIIEYLDPATGKWEML